MDIGVCTSPANVPEPVEGLAFVEPTVAEMLCPSEAEDEFLRRLTAPHPSPLPVRAVNCFLPGTLKTTGPDVNSDAVDAFVTSALQRAQRRGVSIIVFGSGGSRAVPDDWSRERATEQLLDSLQCWGPIAANHGVTIALEPLNSTECNLLNSVDETADLVYRVNHPNVRLLVDTYHMRKDGEGPDSIRRSAPLIVHVHVAERDGRGPLGTTGEDQRAYFRALKDGGYRGGVSIEAKWNDFHAQLPAAVAELRRQIDTA